MEISTDIYDRETRNAKICENFSETTESYVRRCETKHTGDFNSFRNSETVSLSIYDGNCLRLMSRRHETTA